jgi:hypothetical protein
MQVLHTTWDKDRLYLWAESSTLPLSAPGHRGRQPEAKKHKSRAHPFALARDELSEVIKSILEHLIYEKIEFEKKTFLLPSTQKGPLPSPWLIREEDYSAEKATALAGWEIEALTFDPYLAFDFLLGLPEQPPRGLAFGSSLRFWIEVAKFSLELIAKQQFIPSIREAEHDGSTTAFFRAAWEAVITENDEERVYLLAEAMPPCCRAFPEKDTIAVIIPRELNLEFYQSNH